MIGMDVNLYYLYSLGDLTVGLADRSIFVQEVVLQEHVLEICYNSHEKSKFILILKWETSLYVTEWISVTMESIKKYFIYKQTT